MEIIEKLTEAYLDSKLDSQTQVRDHKLAIAQRLNHILTE